MNHIEDLYQRINSRQEEVETIAKMAQVKRIKWVLPLTCDKITIELA